MYENETYLKILDDAKKEVTDSVMKEEGSLVYNALSALAYEVEKLYIQADYIIKQSHADSSDLDGLKRIAADRAIYPNDATCCEVKGEFNCEVPIGARFNLKAYNYVVSEKIDEWNYLMKCEESGTGPNGLIGDLIPITFVSGLEAATITEILVPGKDADGYDELYKKYLESFTSLAFGGNVQDYKNWAKSQDGVGGCKVIPCWNGALTVKIVVQDANFKVPSDYLITQLQQLCCPTPFKGYGFAPIGHDATIEAVTAVNLVVGTNITFENGYSWDTMQEEISEAIDDYLENVRSVWGDSEDGTTVYISRLEARVLDVIGVRDISGTTLNGSGSNLILTLYQIPILESVVNV